MSFHSLQGIVVLQTPFGENAKIVQVYTLQMGMVKIFIKGATQHKRGMSAATELLACSEYVVSKGKNELWQCKEASLIQGNYRLRERMEWLNAACEMAQILKDSQMLEQASPMLYQLFIWSLQNIPRIALTKNLLTVFYLKVLQHDGLFGENEDPFFLRIADCKSLTDIQQLIIEDNDYNNVKTLFYDRISH